MPTDHTVHNFLLGHKEIKKGKTSNWQNSESEYEFYQTPKEIISPLQDALLKILQQSGPITRRDLVDQLNTPRTTVYDNLLKLQKAKVVTKFSRNNGFRGRPLVYWRLK